MKPNSKIRVIGLTGGIGSGKTTVSSLFSKLGATVVNSDQLAREVIEPNTPGNLELHKELSDTYFNSKGELQRRLLRKNLFSQPDLIRKVEKVIHPRVKAEIIKRIDLAKEKKQPYIVIEIPLLFESGFENIVDEIIAVDCSENLQIERASSRDQISESNIKQIIKRQIPRHERVQQADHIIINDGSLDKLQKQVSHLNKVLATPLS